MTVISSYLEGLLLDSLELSAIHIFIYARDQALFKALFFAEDRAADMLQIRASDILYFPDNSGFLFKCIWLKTLRSGDSNVFAFKRGSNRLVCPGRGLEIYFKISSSLGIHLAPGFLFRSVTGSVSPRSLESSAAQARLKLYTASCSGRLSNQNLTIHGFRSRGAVSLALKGINLHEIMDHIGWKTSRTAIHYVKLKQVLNEAGVVARLADLSLELGESYRQMNNLRGFTHAFPI